MRSRRSRTTKHLFLFALMCKQRIKQFCSNFRNQNKLNKNYQRRKQSDCDLITNNQNQIIVSYSWVNFVVHYCIHVQFVCHLDPIWCLACVECLILNDFKRLKKSLFSCGNIDLLLLYRNVCHDRVT